MAPTLAGDETKRVNTRQLNNSSPRPSHPPKFNYVTDSWPTVGGLIRDSLRIVKMDPGRVRVRLTCNMEEKHKSEYSEWPGRHHVAH